MNTTEIIQKKLETYEEYLLKQVYKERPVSVEQFLSDDRYFGKLTDNGRAIFPIWKEKMKEFLNEDSKYLGVFTGGIGVGKTRIAVYCIGYILYKLLCLKNPWKFFDKTAGGKMTISFFNMTKSLSESRAFNILQQHLLASEWFCSRGIITGKNLNQALEFPFIDYALSSPYSAGFNVQGRDVICAVMDEVDSPTASDKQKQRVLSAYESTVRRFESRFVDDKYNETIGKFILVASKQETSSFLDVFVNEHKEDKNLYIADIKYWETKEKGTYSGKTFSVVLGDVYLPPKIIHTREEQLEAQKNGYEVVDVPIEFLTVFERDLVGGLRDIAGISVVGLRKSKLFPSEKSLYECYDDTKEDPANLTTIEIGLQDDIELIRFLDLNKIRVPKNVPRFIHCDIAFSGNGDALSIAMSCVKDWVKKDVERPDGSFMSQKVPVIETDFFLRLKGRPGDEVPMYKVRKLILDIRAAGYNINFSADLVLLSADTKQLLSRSGIPCSYLSLDKDVKPYLSFKELVYEQRWICHRSNILHFELANLEYDKDKQKIDHPHKVDRLEFLEDGGTKNLVVLGTKDASDAVAGSVFRAVESAPAMPVELSTINSVMHRERKDTTLGTFDWVLGRSEAKTKSGLEQYLLQRTDDDSYWIWTRENPTLSPTIKGPFKEKLVNLPVVKVDNPAAYNPCKNITTNEQDFKMNIFKVAKGR